MIDEPVPTMPPTMAAASPTIRTKAYAAMAVSGALRASAG